MKNYLAGFIVLFTAQCFAAVNSQPLQTFLKDFYKNPKKVMWEEPVKTDDQGRPIKGLNSIFPASDIENRDYVIDRDAARQNFCRDINGKVDCLKDHKVSNNLEALSGMAPEDRPENLLELSSIVYSPDQMDQMGLQSGATSVRPWSDTYWPMFEGVLGQRYLDAGFPGSANWAENYNYVQNYNALTILNSRSTTAMGDLSPAEKYDLLMGDNSLTMTNYNWGIGGGYYNSTGSVATWMGICEGWSAAAIFESEALHSVPVTLPGGIQTTFYPSDIRGLASLMWSKASPPVRFIGDRCNVSHPATDPNGRIIDEGCFNTNPGTWHISVVNDVGVAHRSFIMDASYDYQVWNQPVIAYQYSYFNPQTGQTSTSASGVTIPLSSFTRDKFGQYRSSSTQSVVGVSMKVSYVVEAGPTHSSGSRSKTQSVNYVYDLELDGSGDIIGGEWYQAAHPDFLWTPPVGSRAQSIADYGLSPGDWSGSGPVPQNWMNGAPEASQQGQPLEAAVEKLISLSRL